MSFRRIFVTLLLLALACTSVSAQFRSTRNDVSGNTRSGTVTGPPGSETNNTSSRDTTVATDTIQGFSVRKLVRDADNGHLAFYGAICLLECTAFMRGKCAAQRKHCKCGNY